MFQQIFNAAIGQLGSRLGRMAKGHENGLGRIQDLAKRGVTLDKTRVFIYYGKNKVENKDIGVQSEQFPLGCKTVSHQPWRGPYPNVPPRHTPAAHCSGRLLQQCVQSGL